MVIGVLLIFWDLALNRLVNTGLCH